MNDKEVRHPEKQEIKILPLSGQVRAVAESLSPGGNRDILMQSADILSELERQCDRPEETTETTGDKLPIGKWVRLLITEPGAKHFNDKVGGVHQAFTDEFESMRLIVSQTVDAQVERKIDGFTGHMTYSGGPGFWQEELKKVYDGITKMTNPKGTSPAHYIQIDPKLRRFLAIGRGGGRYWAREYYSLAVRFSGSNILEQVQQSMQVHPQATIMALILRAQRFIPEKFVQVEKVIGSPKPGPYLSMKGEMPAHYTHAGVFILDFLGDMRQGPSVIRAQPLQTTLSDGEVCLDTPLTQMTIDDFHVGGNNAQYRSLEEIAAAFRRFF